MSSTIQHLRSTVAGHVPASLLPGQIGINQADGLLFYRDAGGNVASRSLRDYGVVIAQGDVTNVALVDFDITPATIGIMRGFTMSVSAIPATAGAFLGVRFGTSGGINSGSSDYKWQCQYRSSGGYGGDSESGTSYMAVSNNQAVGVSAISGIDCQISFGTNDPTPTMYRGAAWEASYRINSSNIVLVTGCGKRVADIDITTIRLLFSTGNIAKMRYSLVGLLT